MASNGTENSLEKIKKQLASSSGKNLLQGPILKRSETLRKWNERWMILDPTTGKMEYKTRRNETVVKGSIIFDANSTITLSPVNFHGLPKYDGCCIYIGTPQKNEYYLCAETPGAARAWVSTLQATQLVLKAHKEAVNSLSGNGSAQLGTVATVVAAANSTALESSKEIEAAMRISMRAALGNMMGSRPAEAQMDDMAIMMETLRVKDDELQNLARELRSRDSMIKELAEKLSETAEAAEAAASAAYAMDGQRKIVCTEIERLKKDSEQQLESSMSKLRASGEKFTVLLKEREQLLQQRDSALKEAQLWRSELGKAREQIVISEGAVVRAEERARLADVDAEARVKEAMEKQLAALKEKEELLAYVQMLQAQFQRQQEEMKQVSEEETKSCSVSDSLPLTKHVDLSEENVDKACLSDSRSVPHTDGQESLCSIGDGEWNDIQATTDSRIADVREIAPEAEERRSLDISVVNLPVDDHDHHEHDDSSFHQP
ncbi:hypothetical protein MKX01_039725 [Papaver californicum]|nr:hypothetical protein MKX01_039725 [Papaver californicum]